MRVYPVCPELTFHGLRHSHKTWLIAGGAPEIAQARRLGHHLPNRVVEVYSHVAPEVETRLLADLQRRSHKATRNPYPTGPQRKAPVNTRPRTVPQAERQRRVSAAPIAAGGRGNEMGVAHEQRQRGARRPVVWSDVLQKHPNRDRTRRSKRITQDRPRA
ncbi:hypothetical protein AB0C24_14050 [Amycolatopsis japonica]|uniref:hypothetical protein n=1 Tax=Amycolatopsis japonica TaxID=208439 RepID=UPI0033E38B52